MQYGNIFTEVRQRVAAFKYWLEYKNLKNLYGVFTEEDEYLDEAYRFLYSTASRAFIEFCAEKEGRSFEEYCRSLEIDLSKLI